MGTYGEKGRATANHKSSKRRNLQNRAWHTKKQARGKQNITWDQIKHHKYKVTDTMSDHYYRWCILNRTEHFMAKNIYIYIIMQQSLYIYTFPNLSALYKNIIHFGLEEHTYYRAVTPNACTFMAQKYSTFSCTQNVVCL